MTTNIEIEKRGHAIPGTYLHKPYRMTINIPIHNYRVTKRKTDPPFIELSKDDLRSMMKQMNELLLEPTTTTITEQEDDPQNDEEDSRMFLTLEGAQMIQNDKALQIILKNLMKRVDLLEKGYSSIGDGNLSSKY